MIRKNQLGLMCGVVAALIALPGVVLAQDAGAAGQAQQGGFGGRGQRGFGRTVTAATAPVAALDAELNLTADQKKKITAIQDKFGTDVKALLPQPGSQPDQNAAREMFQKVRDLNDKASKEVEDTLNPDQKAKLPGALKDLTNLRSVGIPLETVGDLKLTADQKKKIADIAQDMQTKTQEAIQNGDRAKRREIMQAGRQQALDVLTPEQKAVIDKYQAAHTRPATGAAPQQNN
jgi:hypothetical protein